MANKKRNKMEIGREGGREKGKTLDKIRDLHFGKHMCPKVI